MAITGKLFVAACFVPVFFYSLVSAQETDFEELMYPQISIASLKLLSLRESPGIVTLVTAQEIEDSGARNLVEVLRMVPGFDFGMDVQGALNLAVRGILATDGKVTILVDGQDMTEPFYYSVYPATFFPLEQIKKLEIIRGPGSSIYGGCAELAIINIITKDGGDVDGAAVSAVYGRMGGALARANAGAAYGKKYERDVDLLFSVFSGQSNRSDQDFTDFAGSSYNMADNSRQDPFNARAKIEYRGLKTSAIIDRYHSTQRDDLGTDILTAVRTDFDSYYFDISYEYQLSRELTLTPRFSYKNQTPWKEPQADSGVSNLVYDKTMERYSESFQLSYDPHESVNVITGVEYFEDRAKDNLAGSVFYNGAKSATFTNIAGFAQCLFTTPVVNVTVGARYEDHSQYKSSFVPRVAFTKMLGRLHFKLLGSKAFKAPSIENINIQPDITPEKTTVYEFETGYEFTKNINATANVFDFTVDNPIIYGVNPATLTETYMNFDSIHNRGLELVCRLKYKTWYAGLNYSYYNIAENNVPKLAVPGNEDILLGLPSNKIALNGHITLHKGLSVNPSVYYITERYGYYTQDAAGDPVLKKFSPVAVVNIFLNYRNIFVRNLDIGIGVYDLMNVKYEFVQPYNAGHAPYPGPSREVAMKVSYKY